MHVPCTLSPVRFIIGIVGQICNMRQTLTLIRTSIIYYLHCFQTGLMNDQHGISMKLLSSFENSPCPFQGFVVLHSVPNILKLLHNPLPWFTFIFCFFVFFVLFADTWESVLDHDVWRWCRAVPKMFYKLIIDAERSRKVKLLWKRWQAKVLET